MRMKLIMLVCIVLAISAVFVSCGTSEKTENELSTMKSIDKSFETNNILSFEEVNRDSVSFKEIIATYKVVNNSDEDIDYISLEFAYLDNNGNEICKDGRYYDCQIKAGKSANVKSYSSLNDSDKSLVADIVVNSYIYKIGKYEYDVNIPAKEVSVYEAQIYGKEADFKDANIVTFECTGKGLNIINTYETNVLITNTGKKDIKHISYSIVYYDDNSNCISTDSRYSDSYIYPSKSVNSSSFSDKDFANKISTYEVYKYEYMLNEKDEKGYNVYRVNLQTKTATGAYEEY